MVMWIMSDRAIPRSFRFMEGFGVHTFRLVNAEGKSTFVKFHWKPKLGMQSVVWNEAVKINGADPDFHRRDLWDAIQIGDFPEWELGLQLFDEEFADKFAFDVLDATKIIPEEDGAGAPGRPAGARPRASTISSPRPSRSRSARRTSCPASTSRNDPLLQGRNFSYLDTQLKRLGSPNFTHLPINAPKCPFHHFQQDGHMAFVQPEGARRTTSRIPGAARGRPARVAGHGLHARFPPTKRGRSCASAPRPSPIITARRGSSISARPPIEQAHIAAAFIFELSKVETPAIRARMVSHLLNVDEGLAKKVADGLRPEGAAESRPSRRGRS